MDVYVQIEDETNNPRGADNLYDDDDDDKESPASVIYVGAHDSALFFDAMVGWWCRWNPG
jgi:hypothetical protein